MLFPKFTVHAVDYGSFVNAKARIHQLPVDTYHRALYFAHYNQSVLGAVSNAYLYWLKKKNDALCDECQRLNEMFSRAVDSVSTGERVEIPADLKPRDDDDGDDHTVVDALISLQNDTINKLKMTVICQQTVSAVNQDLFAPLTARDRLKFMLKHGYDVDAMLATHVQYHDSMYGAQFDDDVQICDVLSLSPLLNDDFKHDTRKRCQEEMIKFILIDSQSSSLGLVDRLVTACRARRGTLLFLCKIRHLLTIAIIFKDLRLSNDDTTSITPGTVTVYAYNSSYWTMWHQPQCDGYSLDVKRARDKSMKFQYYKDNTGNTFINIKQEPSGVSKISIDIRGRLGGESNVLRFGGLVTAVEPESFELYCNGVFKTGTCSLMDELFSLPIENLTITRPISGDSNWVHYIKTPIQFGDDIMNVTRGIVHGDGDTVSKALLALGCGHYINKADLDECVTEVLTMILSRIDLLDPISWSHFMCMVTLMTYLNRANTLVNNNIEIQEFDDVLAKASKWQTKPIAFSKVKDDIKDMLLDSRFDQAQTIAALKFVFDVVESQSNADQTLVVLIKVLIKEFLECIAGQRSADANVVMTTLKDNVTVSIRFLSDDSKPLKCPEILTAGSILVLLKDHLPCATLKVSKVGDDCFSASVKNVDKRWGLTIRRI